MLFPPSKPTWNIPVFLQPQVTTFCFWLLASFQMRWHHVNKWLNACHVSYAMTCYVLLLYYFTSSIFKCIYNVWNNITWECSCRPLKGGQCQYIRQLDLTYWGEIGVFFYGMFVAFGDYHRTNFKPCSGCCYDWCWYIIVL